MPNKKTLPVDMDKLLDTFEFDFDGGKLYRNGVNAGHTNTSGYTRVYFNGALHYRHRLLWAAWSGSQPPETIDHIDRDPSNDCINNLREATPMLNQQNRRVSKNNTSGFTGVVRSREKWKAAISVKNKIKYLGVYKTKEDAQKAYSKYKLSVNGPEWLGE